MIGTNRLNSFYHSHAQSLDLNELAMNQGKLSVEAGCLYCSSMSK